MCCTLPRKCQPSFKHSDDTGASLCILLWTVEAHVNTGSCLKCNALSPFERNQALTVMHATRMDMKIQQLVCSSIKCHQ